jgi:[acyl-carrier-protein] S-malonyltransferase
MGKIAFLFPGQGSQELGMGRDLFKNDEYFRHLIDIACDFTGEDLEKLCLKGPERRFIKAQYLQPLLSANSLGYLRHVLENGIKPDVVLGHSLGEITALGAAGVVSDEKTMIMAAKRGRLMDEAAGRCNGTMMAVLFTPLETVEKILLDINKPDFISLANDNAPNQIVLSGDCDILDDFARRIESEKLGKCRKIVVSGPWHSPFIKSAQEAFEVWAEPISFKEPHTDLVLNSTRKPEKDPAEIKKRVTYQLIRPVFWRESMETCKAIGVDTFLEIGPGRVLSGLIRVNGYLRSTPVYSVNNLRGVKSAVDGIMQKS